MDSGRRLREDARACLDAAISAVDPASLVTKAFEKHLETVPTTERDREDFFGENRDWSHVDPRLDEFYKKIEE